MSIELKTFLTSQGVATSRTTPYNPRGNGQCERFNGIIWKTILLALKTNNLNARHWEEVLDIALHSIRSLLCTATNMTPHERMFMHPIRSFNGTSMPTWLANNGPVLMKRFVRNSKYDPLVEEVELLEANHQYAHVRLPDGRETTVSTRSLAPVGENIIREETTLDVHLPDHSNPPEEPEYDIQEKSETLTRPVRIRRPPPYLKDYETNF